MADNTISVPPYDARIGVVAHTEGGTITVAVHDGTVELSGDSAGLRDLARWCLALSGVAAHSGAHVYLNPGITPLGPESTPLLLARDPGIATPNRADASGG
ncbi:hypothetical protein [Krasilnikovia sp. M28-CT-15]|uniref:Imm32 family immunity protein n=1 Tax=Krasilnikovia sp. M28-CT-15 TaxID=3373540 RepID=UPI0038776116